MATTGSHVWMLAPVSRTVLLRIRTCDHVGRGVSLGVDFEVSKARSRPSLVLSTSCLWVMSALSSCLSAVMLFAMMIKDLSSENVPKYAIKYFVSLSHGVSLQQRNSN